MANLIAEVDVKPFVARVSHLSGEIPPFFFLTGHRERFDSLWCRHSRVADEDEMCAAMYLLSADRFLWGKSVAAIQPEIIRFKEIQIHGVDFFLGGGMSSFILPRISTEGPSISACRN